MRLKKSVFLICFAFFWMSSNAQKNHLNASINHRRTIGLEYERGILSHSSLGLSLLSYNFKSFALNHPTKYENKGYGLQLEYRFYLLHKNKFYGPSKYFGPYIGLSYAYGKHQLTHREHVKVFDPDNSSMFQLFPDSYLYPEGNKTVGINHSGFTCGLKLKFHNFTIDIGLDQTYKKVTNGDSEITLDNGSVQKLRGDTNGWRQEFFLKVGMAI